MNALSSESAREICKKYVIRIIKTLLEGYRTGQRAMRWTHTEDFSYLKHVKDFEYDILGLALGHKTDKTACRLPEPDLLTSMLA